MSELSGLQLGCVRSRVTVASPCSIAVRGVIAYRLGGKTSGSIGRVESIAEAIVGLNII